MHISKKRHLILLTLVMAFFSQATLATQFDVHGKLIPPDKQAMQKALKQQRDGYSQLTLKYLKDAAKYGNNNAKYMIGMYHFSQKEWPRGYAWLNLMTGATSEQKAKIQHIQKLISAEEKSAAASIYKQLKPKYSPLANLQHRQKWARQDQVGSRIGGAPAIRSIGSHAPGRNANSKMPGGMTVDASSHTAGEQLQNQITDYVYEFESTIGNVVLGDLELLDNNN